MKTAMKAFCLTLVLIGAGACAPAQAAPASPSAKNPSTVGKTSPNTLTDTLKSNPSSTVQTAASINTASAEELAQRLNGVGLKKAQSIISYREEYGPFKDIDQLQEVPGIGSALVERNRTRIKL